MKEISDIRGNEIAWTQPDWRSYRFQVGTGEDVVGTISWERESWSLAVAKSADGVWSFKRGWSIVGGRVSPWIKIRCEGKNWDTASLRVDWDGNGVLSFTDGRQVQWRWVEPGQYEWKWAWAETPLISIDVEDDGEKNQGVIRVHPQVETVSDASLLVLLGCYLIVIWSHDASVEALAG